MNSAGSIACDKTVHRLIKRAANKVFADGTLTATEEKYTVELPATKASLPEYHELERFADREEYHSRLQLFINAGAVSANWDRRAGDRGQLDRVVLLNPIIAANILGAALPWDIAIKAINSINVASKNELPSIIKIVDAWRYGKSIGGFTADKVNQILDGLRVIEAAENLGADKADLLLRRVSAQLFGDTKRIESLASAIAFLVGSQDDADNEDIFAQLGLVKHPQPLLLSGPKSCSVQTRDGAVPLAQPYVGLRPDTITRLIMSDKPIKQLITIENLASFNEAAQETSNPDDLLIMYVAGNPTPALLAAYKKLLLSIQPSHVLHWGDIDVGGFRIAARLANVAMSVGHKLKLWRMNPMESAVSQQESVGENKIYQLELICTKYGWEKELAGFKQRPVFQEQEFIKWDPPRL